MKWSLILGLLLLSTAAQAGLGKIVSNVKPDITIIGITLNGIYVPGGPIVNIPASKATSFKNGKCLFDLVYNLRNNGNVKTSPLFTNVLKRNNVVVKTHGLLSLGPKENKILGFQSVELSTGMNNLGLYADSNNVVNESKETNNYRKALVKIVGKCKNTMRRGMKRPMKKRGIEHEDIGNRRN